LIQPNNHIQPCGETIKKSRPKDSTKSWQKSLRRKRKKVAIIGGAIGSVVGLSVAPKTGKETREYIKEKGVAAKQKGVKIWEVVKKWLEK
jgi:hypothetical protein